MSKYSNPLDAIQHYMSIEDDHGNPIFSIRESYNAEKLVMKNYSLELVANMANQGYLAITDDEILEQVTACLDAGMPDKAISILLEQNEDGKYAFTAKQMNVIAKAILNNVPTEQLSFMTAKDSLGDSFFNEKQMNLLLQGMKNHVDVEKMATRVGLIPSQRYVNDCQKEINRFVSSFEDISKVSGDDIILPPTSLFVELHPFLDRFQRKLGHGIGFTYDPTMLQRKLTKGERQIKRNVVRQYNQVFRANETFGMHGASNRRIVDKMMKYGLNPEEFLNKEFEFKHLYQFEKMIDAQIEPDRIMQLAYSGTTVQTWRNRVAYDIKIPFTPKKLALLRQLEIRGIDMMSYQDRTEKELKRMLKDTTKELYVSNVDIYKNNSSFGYASPAYRKERMDLYLNSPLSSVEKARQVTQSVKSKLRKELEKSPLTKSQAEKLLAHSDLDKPDEFIFNQEQRQLIIDNIDILSNSQFEALTKIEGETAVFDAKQIKNLCHAIEVLPTRKANTLIEQSYLKGYNAEQISEIGKGLKNNVEVRYFSNPLFTAKDMQAIRCYIEQGNDISRIQGYRTNDPSGNFTKQGHITEYIKEQTGFNYSESFEWDDNVPEETYSPEFPEEEEYEPFDIDRTAQELQEDLPLNEMPDEYDRNNDGIDDSTQCDMPFDDLVASLEEDDYDTYEQIQDMSEDLAPGY